ncbi:MAG: protein translocase subunit yidC [Bryobacterales bacterium]|nr:protein translocase subunit yidC [Bryobacterales bacterium]
MSSPTPPKKKQLSSELRMALAFALMGIILYGSQWVYKKLGYAVPGSTETKTQTTKAATGQTGATGAAETAANAPLAPGGPEAPAAAVAASNETEWSLNTDVYHVVFTNRGAAVKSWTLRKFQDSHGKPLELVNVKGAQKVAWPFTYAFRNQKPTADLNTALWVPKPSSDGLGITYEFSDGQTTASKTFAFTKSGYLVQLADEVKVGSQGIPHLLQWRGGFGDMAVDSPESHQASIHYDLEKNKLVSEGAKAAKDGPLRQDGQYSFAGIEDQYFTAVFLAPVSNQLRTTTFYDQVGTPTKNEEAPFPGVAAGGEARNQLGVFVGPKQLAELQAVNPKLQNVIDWGWFGLIAKPLFLVLQWMTSGLVPNYGWAIIVLTIAINIAMFPLKLANLKSMRKMQALQPQLAKINEKYKGLSMTDPKAQNKQAETMALYKQHGVNPMGGCLPMLIQLPFLYAFYKVLSVTVELRHADWLWVTDLSQPEHLAIRVLPIVMVASSFLMQKMTPMTGADPSQQKMMQFMPLMWGYFFWSASSGLVLYWLTSNVVGIAQQWFFNQTAAPNMVIKTPPTIQRDGRKKA